jgi:hypothetical protein
MLKWADKLPLTGQRRDGSLRGTLVLPEELPHRPPRLDDLAISSLPDVLGRQGYVPGSAIVLKKSLDFPHNPFPSCPRTSLRSPRLTQSTASRRLLRTADCRNLMILFNCRLTSGWKRSPSGANGRR